MGRKVMQRTFVTTLAEFSVIENINGNIDVIKKDPIKLVGKLDEVQATKAIKKLEGFEDLNLMVTGVSHEEEMYTMSVDKFLELADKTTETQEQIELKLAEQPQA